MKRLQETIEAKRRPDVPRQLAIAFEAPQLWMMQPPERQRIVSSLANLLLQAAGDDPLEEDGDDRRRPSPSDSPEAQSRRIRQAIDADPGPDQPRKSTPPV